MPSFKVNINPVDKVIKNNVSTQYNLEFFNNEEEDISDVAISIDRAMMIIG